MDWERRCTKGWARQTPPTPTAKTCSDGDDDIIVDALFEINRCDNIIEQGAAWARDFLDGQHRRPDDWPEILLTLDGDLFLDGIKSVSRGLADHIMQCGRL